MTDDHEMRLECSGMFRDSSASNEAVVKEIQGLRSDVQAQTQANDDQHILITRILSGHPGDADKPGLVGRVDRIEQKDKHRVWALGFIIAAILGLAGAVGKLIHSGHAK